MGDALVNGPVLQGARLALRPIAPADLSLMVGWRNRPDVRRNIYNQPRLTIAAQRVWFGNYLADRSQVRFIADSKALGPIGVFGLTDLRPAEGSALLGALLGEPAARGQGLACEALELLLDFGFRRWDTGSSLGLNRVTAEVFDHNKPAIALYQKVGFKDEGRLRQAHRDSTKGRYVDVLVMGLLRKEWLGRS
jgi:RimJ/RimL family protein N-acetyltransferase